MAAMTPSTARILACAFMRRIRCTRKASGPPAKGQIALRQKPLKAEEQEGPSGMSGKPHTVTAPAVPRYSDAEQWLKPARNMQTRLPGHAQCGPANSVQITYDLTGYS